MNTQIQPNARSLSACVALSLRDGKTSLMRKRNSKFSQSSLPIPIAERWAYKLKPIQPRFGLFLLISLVGVLLLGIANAAKATEGSTSEQLHFSLLVENLGDAQFAKRTLATQQLLAAGPRAMSALMLGVRSADYETQCRSLVILEAIASSHELEVQQAVLDRLSELSQEADPATKRMVAAAIESICLRRRTHVVKELESWGATVRTEDAGSSVLLGRAWKGGAERVVLVTQLGDVQWLSFEHARLGDSALEQVAKLPRLHHLYLGDSQMSGAGLAGLQNLEELRYLSLRNLPLTPEAIQKFPPLKKLESLGLDGTPLNDEGLKHLAQYENLRTLWLDGTRITQAGLPELAKMKSLSMLYLSQTKVSGGGLSTLRELPRLTSLSLKGTQLTVDDMERLSELRQLESLGLDHANITDEHLAKLQNLPKLRILWLSKTQVTDASIVSLAKFKELETLYLHASGITEHGAKKLKESLPNCHVYR